MFPHNLLPLLRGAAPRGVFVAVACRAVASVARRRAVEQRLRHKLSVSAIHIEVLLYSVYSRRCIPLMPQQTYTAWAMPMARLSPSHDCSHVAASSQSSSEMSVLEPTWSARSKAVLIEGGSVRGQLVLGEEGGGGLRHLCGRAGAGTGSAERGKLAV